MGDSGDDGVEFSSTDSAENCRCGSNNCSEFCRRRSSSSSLPSSSSSCSLLSFDSYPVQDYDKPWRVYTASVKGFAISAGLKGGLAIFALLNSLSRRQLLPSSKPRTSPFDGASPLKQLQRFSYSELRNATNNFSSSNCIGKGGFLQCLQRHLERWEIGSCETS